MSAYVEHLCAGELVWLARRHREIIVLNTISPGARWLSRVLRAAGLSSVRELAFDFMDDVRMLDGTLGQYELLLNLVPSVAHRIERDPAYARVARQSARVEHHAPYIDAYLMKRLFRDLWSHDGSELRSLLIVAWDRRRHLGSHALPTLYTRPNWRFPWVVEHARQCDIELRLLPAWPTTISRLVRRGKGRLRAIQRLLSLIHI